MIEFQPFFCRILVAKNIVEQCKMKYSEFPEILLLNDAIDFLKELSILLKYIPMTYVLQDRIHKKLLHYNNVKTKYIHFIEHSDFRAEDT